MQPKTRVDTVRAVMAAWARHDIDELLTHIGPDIEWHYHVGSRPVQGRDAMRTLLERLKDHQLDSQWRVVHHAEAGDVVMIEAIDDYRNPAGNRVQVPYMGVYRFDGDLIVEWRDYLDMGLMTKAEQGEAADPWLGPLIDRGR